jgi:hypothetical protein
VQPKTEAIMDEKAPELTPAIARMVGRGGVVCAGRVSVVRVYHWLLAMFQLARDNPKVERAKNRRHESIWINR